jgi:hypothetical protein
VCGLNSTFIVLILNISNPQWVSYFRHISLVRCLYEVLAKVLANRLRGGISKIISDTQLTLIL